MLVAPSFTAGKRRTLEGTWLVFYSPRTKSLWSLSMKVFGTSRNISGDCWKQDPCLQAFTDSRWLDASPMTLSEDQMNVLQIARKQRYIFLTGQAGTGKTNILHQIYRDFTGRNEKVLVCASTGKAASSINGHTFQYFVGIDGNRSFKLLSEIDCVMIDEVSMIPHLVLENFDSTARRIRGSTQPFGGLRMILCGDFLQLPAVTKEKSSIALFETKLFKENFYPITLKTVHRVFSEYSLFRKGLEDLRRGTLTQFMCDILQRRTGATVDMSKATFLFSRRKDAAHRNLLELMKLTGPSVNFPPCLTEVKLSSGWISPIVFQFQKSKVLDLLTPVSRVQRAIHYIVNKEGAVKNLDHSSLAVHRLGSDSKAAVFFVSIRTSLSQVLQNTSRKARAIRDDLVRSLRFIGATILAKTRSDIHEYASKLASISPRHYAEDLQLRVRARVMLTRNLTATLVNGSIGEVETFVPAQSCEGRDVLPHSAYQHVGSFVNALREMGDMAPVLPLVRFSSGQRVLVPPIVSERVDTAQGFYREVLSVPLILAWSMTFHKSQGQTLKNQVVVDFKNSFHSPHVVYVALSRVRSPEQLVIRGFTQDLIKVCPKALEFDNGLRKKEM